ncbi:MAG: hypothetical protein FJ403_14980 [Verrucomicrobia bacterium]|nr:hypothetical protein [Verrucomicrobiota bacterium]
MHERCSYQKTRAEGRSPGQALIPACYSHLHGQQLIHRDIKPSNIIFVRDVPKFADIGLVTDLVRTETDRTYVGTCWSRGLHSLRWARNRGGRHLQFGQSALRSKHGTRAEALPGIAYHIGGPA